eukprot:1203884-Pyramimonas_sp.AAC.2
MGVVLQQSSALDTKKRASALHCPPTTTHNRGQHLNEHQRFQRQGAHTTGNNPPEDAKKKSINYCLLLPLPTSQHNRTFSTVSKVRIFASKRSVYTVLVDATGRRGRDVTDSTCVGYRRDTRDGPTSQQQEASPCARACARSACKLSAA